MPAMDDQGNDVQWEGKRWLQRGRREQNSIQIPPMEMARGAARYEIDPATGKTYMITNTGQRVEVTAMSSSVSSINTAPAPAPAPEDTSNNYTPCRACVVLPPDAQCVLIEGHEGPHVSREGFWRDDASSISNKPDVVRGRERSHAARKVFGG